MSIHNWLPNFGGDGSVVVGYSESALGKVGYRWTADGGMVGLGYLPGDGFTYALGVSGDGSVVVGYSGSRGDFFGDGAAYRWTAGGGMVGLGYLPGGTLTSFASGVSGDGSVVVGASGGRAFRWTSGGGMVGLGSLPGGSDDSRANGVTGDGSIIVGQAVGSSGVEAFRWTSGGGMVSLGPASYANAVSADGSVVVGGQVSIDFEGDPLDDTQAFRWTSSGGMIGLGNLPGGHQGWANGVSGDGSVIVGESYLDNGAQAFRWTSSGGMERLWDVLLAGGVDPAASGWTEFYSARGVSLDGNTIVGHGMRNGNFEAFVAVVSIVPEPATIVLGGILLAALLGALSHRSKSRRSRQLWPDATDASGRQSGGRSRLRWAPVGTRPQFTLNQ